MVNLSYLNLRGVLRVIYRTSSFFLLGLQGSALRTASVTYTNAEAYCQNPVVTGISFPNRNPLKEK